MKALESKLKRRRKWIYRVGFSLASLIFRGPITKEDKFDRKSVQQALLTAQRNATVYYFDSCDDSVSSRWQASILLSVRFLIWANNGHPYKISGKDSPAGIALSSICISTTFSASIAKTLQRADRALITFPAGTFSRCGSNLIRPIKSGKLTPSKLGSGPMYLFADSVAKSWTVKLVNNTQNGLWENHSLSHTLEQVFSTTCSLFSA